MFWTISISTDRKVEKHNDRVVMNQFSLAWSAPSTGFKEFSAALSVDDPVFCLWHHQINIILKKKDFLWIKSVLSPNQYVYTTCNCMHYKVEHTQAYYGQIKL